jgi:predicted HTH transcriptional regulator
MLTKQENQNIEFKRSWSSIEKIVTESKSFNDVEPQFRYNAGLYITFYFKNYGENLGDRVGEKVGEKTRVKTRVKIIALLKEDKYITNQELADTLGLSAKGIEW